VLTVFLITKWSRVQYTTKTFSILLTTDVLFLVTDTVLTEYGALALLARLNIITVYPLAACHICIDTFPAQSTSARKTELEAHRQTDNLPNLTLSRRLFKPNGLASRSIPHSEEAPASLLFNLTIAGYII